MRQSNEVIQAISENGKAHQKHTT